MKKSFKKRVFTASAVGLVALGSVGGFIPATNLFGNVAVADAATTVPSSAVAVKTIEEFENALKNVKVKEISVQSSIKFKRNITDIPARAVTIYGNKDQGVVIDSNIYSIYGKQGNTLRKNLFSVIDANITGDDGVGRFFTGGAGNGPSSFGWDAYVKDTEYTGARFMHLSEGKLTFAGTNTISTRCENAWVHDLEFEEGSVYNGQAAMTDYGQFSAFYFNGSLIDGKCTGRVDIGDDAKVNVEISPQSNINYYYPVFYDKVYQVNVGLNAELNVDAAGVAFQFIPRGDYLNIPSLNLSYGSKVHLNGRGGGNYATMKLQEYGTQVNLDNDSELVIDGNSSRGVVESIYEFASFNMYAAKNLEITNYMKNQNLFYGDRTFIRGVAQDHIYTWAKTGKYTDKNYMQDMAPNDYVWTYVGLLGDGSDNEKSAEVHARNANTSYNLNMGNYGKIRFTGNASGGN